MGCSAGWVGDGDCGETACDTKNRKKKNCMWHNEYEGMAFHYMDKKEIEN